jgi:hypothetical protein
MQNSLDGNVTERELKSTKMGPFITDMLFKLSFKKITQIASIISMSDFETGNTQTDTAVNRAPQKEP